MNRVPDGEELKKIQAGITEGERIDTARLIANAQGKLDERFCLKNWVERRPTLVRWLLRKLLWGWFELRDEDFEDYGLDWNRCTLRD